MCVFAVQFCGLQYVFCNTVFCCALCVSQYRFVVVLSPDHGIVHRVGVGCAFISSPKKSVYG